METYKKIDIYSKDFKWDWNNEDHIRRYFHESNLIEEVYSNEADDLSFEAFNKFKNKIALTLQDILEIHQYISGPGAKFLNSYAQAGVLRTYDVRVGNDIKIPYIDVGNKLSRYIENDLTDPFSRGLLLTSRMYIIASHLDFEDIHPFGDGNGRVGRLIMLWQFYRAFKETPMKAEVPIIFSQRKREQIYYPMFKLRKLKVI